MQKKKKVSKVKAKPAKPSNKGSKPAKIPASKPVSKKPTKKAASKNVAKKVQTLKTRKPKAEPSLSVAATSVSSISKAEFKNMSVEAQEHYKKWLKLQKTLADEKTQEYRMTEDFELKTPLSHKVHGWGVVVQKRDNYIDVLFETGMKTLIVNYKL